jgi:hypothetical protein
MISVATFLARLYAKVPYMLPSWGRDNPHSLESLPAAEGRDAAHRNKP